MLSKLLIDIIAHQRVIKVDENRPPMRRVFVPLDSLLSHKMSGRRDKCNISGKEQKLTKLKASYQQIATLLALLNTQPA